MAADPVALLRAFVAALQTRRRAAVNEPAFALIEQAAPLGDKWRLVAQVMQTNGEIGAANRAMELLVAQSGYAAAARFEQAALAAQTGRIDRAEEVVRTVPAGVPNEAAHAYLLGTMALNRGDTALAESHLLAALDANPRLGSAMLALAVAKKRSLEDPISRRILSAEEAMAGAPMNERAQYRYAAGRLLFDNLQIEPAFANFEQGAALAAKERPYDIAADREEARRGMTGFDRQTIEGIARQVEPDSSESIVVIGLPRSGTTLVEQILASHSAVVGGDELASMTIVSRELPENSGDGLATYLKNHSPDELARLYLHLCRERFGAGGRYVDKALGNTRHIGLIAALLPQTPIVWLRRDPLDCAFSAFSHYFVQGLDWSWKLEDIAAHFRLEDKIFAFWTELLSERILVVDFADLVGDPKGQIERILRHCNLSPEPRVFEPHKTERVVATTSSVQVREPINRKGLGGADPYRRHLQPFIQAYEG